MPAAPLSPRASRRGVLVAALVGVGAGCSRLTDPVVHGSHSLSPEPVPTPDAAFVEAAGEVSRHAALVSALRPAPASAPALARMFAAHQSVLSARRPLEGGERWITPSPVPTPAGVDAGRWAASAKDLAAAHEGRCLAAPAGAMAMLWGSLAVATAATASAAGPAPQPGPRPRAVKLAAETDTRNVLLSHLHALAQVLELGVGATRDQPREVFERRLGEVRRLVGAQQRQVRALGGDPAAPLPGYRWPGPVTTPAQITATWALVEERVLAAHGPVVGSTATDRRAAALTQMVGQVGSLRARGRGVPFFPGWA